MVPHLRTAHKWTHDEAVNWKHLDANGIRKDSENVCVTGSLNRSKIHLSVKEDILKTVHLCNFLLYFIKA